MHTSALAEGGCLGACFIFSVCPRCRSRNIQTQSAGQEGTFEVTELVNPPPVFQRWGHFSKTAQSENWCPSHRWQQSHASRPLKS